MSLSSHASALPPSCSPACRRAFSLVEVAIALGIVAFAMLTIVGFMQVGLVSLNDSVNDSMTSLILNDVRARLEGTPFPSDADLASGAKTPLPSLFYDRSGQSLETDAAGKVAGASYRVDIVLGAPQAPLPDARVAVAVLTIAWPPDPLTGEIPQGSHNKQLSLLVTPATDRGWTEASSSYQPRIGQ